LKQVVVCTDGTVARWVSARLGVQGFSDYSEIGLTENGKLIAGVVFDYFNGASINMHVAAVGKRWMTREYLHFCFWYPFEQLKVKRINGLVPESNLAARKFDEHLGFELEARLQDAHPSGDVLVYRMFKKDCRWLNMKVRYGQTVTA
jgi:RimJ/RimL family protein N-acetyltransferase